MLSPPQRELGAVISGTSDSCYWQNGPCGQTTPSKNKLYLRAGQQFTVVVQNNLGHYNAGNPGYWSVSIGKEGGTLKELRRTKDTDAPNLAVFSTTVTIPEETGEDMIIQTKYITNNPNAPPEFYQCADVVVFRPSEDKAPVDGNAALSGTPAPTNCSGSAASSLFPPHAMSAILYLVITLRLMNLRG